MPSSHLVAFDAENCEKHPVHENRQQGICQQAQVVEHTEILPFVVVDTN